MEWLNILLGALVAIFAGLNIFQLVSFRAYKNMHQAQAEKGEAEASAAKQSALESRLASIERLYGEQGKVIDDLRERVLNQSKEKFDLQTRIVQLEGENRALTEKVAILDKTVQAYKTIAEKPSEIKF